MANYPTRSPYTAELQRQRGLRKSRGAPASGCSTPCAEDADAAEVAPAAAGRTGDSGLLDGCECNHKGAKHLADMQGELRQLKDSIDHMKLEIATLRHNDAPPAPWERATSELDAVVQATETATQTILEAAERIDALLFELREHGATPIEALNSIGEHVVRIFEACNFQDITGQRITKVVGAMKFIELRIDRMIEILGGQDALRGIEVAVPEPADAEAALLEGPQLDGEHKISQNDIDRFFD